MDTQPYQCDLLSLCPFTVQAAQVPAGEVAFPLAGEERELLTGAPDHTCPWQWQLGCHCRAGVVFCCRAADSPLPQMIFIQLCGLKQEGRTALVEK